MKRLITVISGIVVVVGVIVAIFALQPNPYEVADMRPNGNDYPAKLANAPMNSVSVWGSYNRECGSYVAWKVYENYHDMPTGWNQNVKDWPELAKTSGFNVSSTPGVGTVAIAQPGTVLKVQTSGNIITTTTASSTGHAMWVQQVNSDGTILVSQYNANNDGQFSYSTVQSAGLQYIYFNQKQ